MISKNTVFAMTPIALALNEKQINLEDKVHDFLIGLSTQSTGGVVLTDDNVADELPKATVVGSDHHFLQDKAAELLADGVKRAFLQIRQFIKPFDESLKNAIRDNYVEDPIHKLHSNYRIYFYDIWSPFFDSPMFPESKPNQIFDYTDFPIDKLKETKNKFPSFGEEEFKEKIQSKLKGDILDFIDTDVLYDVYRDYLVSGYWEGLFSTKVADVRNVTKNFDTWISLYALVGRLIADEDPLEGVVGLTLDQYNELLHAVHDLCIAALQQLRRAGEVIRPSKVHVTVDNKKYRDFQYLGERGLGCTVGITEEGVAFADSKDGTLSEAIIGYLISWEKVNGNSPLPPVVDGWEQYVEVYRSTLKDVEREQAAHGTTKIRSIVIDKVNEFQKSHPEFRTFILGLNDDIEYRRLSTAMEGPINAYTHEILEKVYRNGNDLEAFLSRGTLSVELCRFLKMDLAADILEGAVSSSALPVEERRKILGVSVAKALVKGCFVK